MSNVLSYGILLDENFDLKDDGNGDFAIGVTNQQEAQLVMLSKTGDWKQTPNMGVNMLNYINSNTQSSFLLLQQAITTALQNDGFNVSDLSFTNDDEGNLNVQTDATRFR